MNIKEIKLEKLSLEHEMQRNISLLLDRFIAKTGMRVEEITINMIETTSLGDDRSKYTFGQVKVELERI